MGGLWSGQRVWKKAVVEGRLALDTTDLKRMKLLTPRPARSGSLRWSRGDDPEPSSSVGYTLTVGEVAGALRLDYTVGASGERVGYTVRLVTTRCHLGGVRWWFLCPLATNGVACGRRVRKLHLRGKFFGCRRCHDLTYTSCQESDSRVYAALRGGFTLDPLGDPGRMSVVQLGFALKVLTFEQNRLDRWLTRNRGRQGVKVNANND